MSAEVGSNYMSDGAILAWVTAQQNRLYGELSKSMDLQKMQGEMTSDLADIKQHLVAANKDPKKFVELEKELQAFESKYGGVPELAEIVETVSGLQVDLTGRLDAIRDSDAYKLQLAAYQAGVLDEPEIVITKYDDATLKSFTDAIDGKLDGAGTNEQLGMIHLNEINSTIHQTAEQASLLIKSDNDTTNAIIRNL